MKPSFRWKVPFRSIWCRSFSSWLRFTVWCHLVLRWYPDAESCVLDCRMADPARLLPKWQRPLVEAVHETINGDVAAALWFRREQ